MKGSYILKKNCSQLPWISWPNQFAIGVIALLFVSQCLPDACFAGYLGPMILPRFIILVSFSLSLLDLDDCYHYAGCLE